MNPDTGEEAEDWFARFEREAREAAQQREQEQAAAAQAAPPVEPPAAPPLVTPPAAPQLANPFDAPPAAPLQPSPPPLWEPEATQAMPAVDAELVYDPGPTQAMPAMPEPEATQAMPALPDPGPTEAIPATGVSQDLERAPLRPPQDEADTALDNLFGDERFRDYDASLGGDPSNAPWANRGRSKEVVAVAPSGGGTPPPPGTLSRLQKILLGAGGGLLAVLALVALFLAGTRIPDLVEPEAEPTPMPTPTPTLTALPIGPVEPGEHLWAELLGGECLEPYVDAWQVEYTVVDCAEPHGGQLVLRAWFPDADADPAVPWVGRPDDPFPGEEALAAQITILCSAAGVYDVAAAAAYTDAAIQGAYPVTAEQWEDDPSYYCFVSRTSGEPLTGTLAVPRA